MVPQNQGTPSTSEIPNWQASINRLFLLLVKDITWKTEIVVKHLKMSKFIFDVNQLKVSKLIWDLMRSVEEWLLVTRMLQLRYSRNDRVNNVIYFCCSTITYKWLVLLLPFDFTFFLFKGAITLYYPVFTLSCFINFL